MRRNLFFIPGLISLLIFASDETPHVKARPNHIMESRWTGKLTLEEKYTGLTGTSERKVTVNFVNVLPTLGRDGPAAMDPDSVLYGQTDSTNYNSNFTDDKGTGSVTFHGDLIMSGKKIGYTDCSGSSKSQLNEVGIDPENNTYRIHAIGPACNGTNVSLLDGRTEPYGPDHTDIIVDGEPVVNKHLLAGSKTEQIDMGGDLGIVTRTTIWYLATDNEEVELIVTPENYNDWIPEPGANELTKGNTMKIDLKLIGRNGRPPTKKARSFKLKLNETSKEPGITLNAPLTPISTLPDLRFLVQANAAVDNEFQDAAIRPADGITASIVIGSFDGGGYTTLTVTTTLEDNSEIEGHLLISGGNTEIPIPKRPAGSNIATKWLVAHNNPQDIDDIETSPGCNNNGDGLTAYEEYRGVISKGRHERLDPAKKEVGVKMKRAEMSFFGDGITKFENASGLKVIRFAENEIGADRKLNKNKLSAHVYDQYTLFLQKGALSPDLGKSFGGPGIPKQISKTVIAENNIRQAYRDRIAEANSMNTQITYTLADMFAIVTAHELAHSVSVQHHGSLAPNSMNLQVQQGRPVRIFSYNGTEILTRPYPVTGRAGDKGNEQSGDVNCFMVNNALCDWAVKNTPDSAFFFEVPPIPLGTILCTKKDGTGLNKKDANGNNNYFSDAANGNCLSQIKLK